MLLPGRFQWDPDRDTYLNKLDHRALQIGLQGELVHKYAREWILKIEVVTALAHQIDSSIQTKTALPALPHEREYVLPKEVMSTLGMS